MSVGRFLQQAAAGAGGPSDPDFANVVLLLDGDGTSGDANNTFTDSSTNGFTVTESGSVLQGSFSPYGDNWSVYFDGSSYIDTASGPTNLGSGDFTVEFWINTTATGFNIMNPTSSTGNGFWGLMVQSGDLRWNNQYALTNLWVVEGGPILDGNWHHVAIIRNSDVFKVFYDGVSQSIKSGSFTDPYDYPTQTSLRVGDGNLGNFLGHLSNIRLVSGTAIYSSNFDSPTAPFTNSASYTERAILCQSNRFIDNGNNSYAITTSGSPQVTPFSPFKDSNARTLTADGGSANFDSSEYLTIADNASLDVSGAMTAECWVYITDMPDGNIGASGQGFLINRWTASGNQRSWAFLYGNNGDIAFYSSSTGGSSYTISTATGVLGIGGWTHVAASWDGTNQRLFIDGDLKVTTANASGPYSTPNSGVTVNAINTSLTGTNINQYIADARYFADAAIYTSSFTPPTSPLTATSGSDTATVLLNFQDAGIYNRSGINNLDTVGNAQIDTAVKKYGTGSIEFDGTGDGLSSPETTSFGFGSGDFTIEAWAYLTTNGVFNNIVSAGIDSSNGYRLDISTSNNLRFLADIGSWITVITGSTSLATGQWYHLAVTRNGNNFNLWVDGSSDATTVSNSGTIADPTTKIEVGAVTTNSLNRSFNGYLDDVRVTKGIARYTANFTPPDAALPKF
jgi:hypothetical protein